MPVTETLVGAFPLSEHPEYRSTSQLDTLREVDYAHMDAGGHVYLDFTGGNMYSKSQLTKHMEMLQNHVFGNPHSTNPTSVLATQLVEKTRAHVLSYFNASDDYFCVFTNNASGALKIVGENYIWTPESKYLLAFDNHNSVNGIREYAKEHGAQSVYVPLLYQNLRLDEGALLKELNAPSNGAARLFALPAQSNVSGVKHPLRYVKMAQDLGWDVLLDSAAFVPSNRLDLKEVQPDFVTVSFYKIFGYPTGVGCLFIKKTSFEKLQKHWFAGGTVTYVSVMADKYYLTKNHERFEDGTLDYLGIPAVSIGLDHIESIGLDVINRRVGILTNWLLQSLQGLRHTNGRPMVHIFGPTDLVDRGGTIIFNLQDKEGETIPFYEVETAANQAFISLRTGCFCNPGIDEVNTCMTQEALSAYFSDTGHVDFKQVQQFFGKLRGAIRVSVGLASNARDVEHFIEFVHTFASQRTSA